MGLGLDNDGQVRLGRKATGIVHEQPGIVDARGSIGMAGHIAWKPCSGESVAEVEQEDGYREVRVKGLGPREGHDLEDAYVGLVGLKVRDGRLQKGMQSFGTSPQVMENMDHLYAYLKGRSDGAIKRARVEPIQ